jgi:nucleoside-diphosphate-sugar epimerase
MNPINILITGGFGNIGLPLANELITKHHNVHVIDNMCSQESLDRFGQMNFRAKITYTDINYIEHMWTGTQFHTVVHLAAIPIIDSTDANYEQLFTDNVLGTMKVLNKCISNKSKFIYLQWPYDSGILQLAHNMCLNSIEYYKNVHEIPVVIIDCTDKTTEEILQNILQEI